MVTKAKPDWSLGRSTGWVCSGFTFADNERTELLERYDVQSDQLAELEKQLDSAMDNATMLQVMHKQEPTKAQLLAACEEIEKKAHELAVLLCAGGLAGAAPYFDVYMYRQAFEPYRLNWPRDLHFVVRELEHGAKFAARDISQNKHPTRFTESQAALDEEKGAKEFKQRSDQHSTVWRKKLCVNIARALYGVGFNDLSATNGLYPTIVGYCYERIGLNGATAASMDDMKKALQKTAND